MKETTVRSDDSAERKSLKSRSVEAETGERGLSKNVMEETLDNSDDSQRTEDGMYLAFLASSPKLHMNGDTSPRGTLESPSPPLATSSSVDPFEQSFMSVGEMDQSCMTMEQKEEAVVIRSLPGGCTEARVRDFGTVVIPSAVNDVGTLLPGDWLSVEFPVMTLKNSTLLSDLRLPNYWTATRIHRILCKLPLVQKVPSLKIREVPAVVVDNGRVPRVYSEALGLITLRTNSAKGFDPEEFLLKDFVWVSVAPLTQCNSSSGQDSCWIAEDIRKDTERKLKDTDFPSLKVRRIKEFFFLGQGWGYITVS